VGLGCELIHLLQGSVQCSVLATRGSMKDGECLHELNESCYPCDYYPCRYFMDVGNDVHVLYICFYLRCSLYRNLNYLAVLVPHSFVQI
jgi:hypothetical protein